MKILKTYTVGGAPNGTTKRNAPKPRPSVQDGGTTQGVTKSGTTVFVEGEDSEKRKRALHYFLKVYNNDFSMQEQKKNRNLVYKLTSKIVRRGFASASCAVPNQNEIKKYHIVGRKIFVLSFTDESSKMESVITHELVHTRKYANNKFGSINHNEQKIDFETVGRISKGGFDQDINSKTPWTGTYYNVNNSNHKKTHFGNPYLTKLKLPFEKKIKVAVEGKIHDRKLLTGSLNTNIVGKVASSRSEKLFPKSFFNIKYILDEKK